MPERRAQDVVDALPDGVVLAGDDGRVTVISQVAASMLGVSLDGVGQPLADVLALRYARSRGGRVGFARLELELSVSERHGRGLAERLGALVEVRDVVELQR